VKPDHRVKRRLIAGLFVAATVGMTVPVTTASAHGGGSWWGGGHHGRSCERRINFTYRRLLECVTLEGVREHQAAFQRIADRNDDPYYPGSRAAGTEGYADSVDYVVRKLKKAGYKVTLDEFEFDFVFPSVLQQVTPTAADYLTGTFTGSGSGDVTAAVTPVDINLADPAAATSGCDGAFTEEAVGAPIVEDPDGPNDFEGFTAGNVALLQRGACSFGLKAVNAQAAGASAVIIFNQGNDPTRVELIVGNAEPPEGSTAPGIAIPVVGASFADGSALAAAETVRVAVPPNETRTDVNIIAEKRGRNRDNVVMAGAHLDSVGEGPGINDNGSGSAALLETAENLARFTPQNTLRFAWWGAEESGLIGSTAWVNEQVAAGTLSDVALYMNFDMVGSPNHIFMVYDADQSSFPAPVPVPDGSAAIEDTFESYYTLAEVPYDDSEFSGRSDYQAFIVNGIPSSGLFTGAEVPKTEEQAAIWGGTAGDQFDPCYHAACDTYENNNDQALEINADAIAFAVLTYAYSTESVNGVPGRRVPGHFEIPAPAGPEGTFVD
jgi:Zn-dependent M28 family amino/carboxypeptidase